MASNTDLQDSKVLSTTTDQRGVGRDGWTPVGMLYRKEGGSRLVAAEGVAADPHSSPSNSVV